MVRLKGIAMAFPSEKFHTSPEVWNKYGTRNGAWIGLLPYLPYLPYLVPPAHIRAGVRACACTCMRSVFMVWKVWKVWKSSMNKGSPTSTPVPYLNAGMEPWKLIGGLNG